MDLVDPEEKKLIMSQLLLNITSEEKITFVQVPLNLYELNLQFDEENICVVCRVVLRTRHALVPFGQSCIQNTYLNTYYH